MPLEPSSANPSKTYQAHRENQIDRILEAAERLFVRDGIDRVSLSDIARAARMTRKTLYEYFPNKEEVVWSIFQKVVAVEIAAFIAGWPLKTGSGFDQVAALMGMFAHSLEQQPQHWRFIVEFNTLYAREANVSRLVQMRGQFPLVDVFRQGIADGSLRPDLDPDLLASAMLNLLNAMNSRFSLLGSQISQEYDQPVMEMYREICGAFLRGIQPDRPTKPL